MNISVTSPRRQVAVAVALVQLAVTAVYAAVPDVSNDARLLYVCAAPIAASALRLRAALFQLMLTGALVAFALAIHGGPIDSAVRRWSLTVGVVAVVGGVVVIIAASARRHVDEMDHAATHDPLTGLANRTRLGDATDAALRRLHEAGVGQVFMVVIDLDRFKLLNDTHGHHTGDQLLVALAKRLSRCAPSGAVVCRLGGDEFAILVDDPQGRLAAADVATAIAGAWAEPVAIDRGAVRTSGCVGVAIATQTDDTSSLLRHADAAMYRAKSAGRSGTCI